MPDVLSNGSAKVSELYMHDFEETLTQLRIIVGAQEERYSQILKELGRVSALADDRHEGLKKMIADNIHELRRIQIRHEAAISAMEKKVSKAHWFLSGVAATGAALGAAGSWMWQFIKGGG